MRFTHALGGDNQGIDFFKLEIQQGLQFVFAADGKIGRAAVIEDKDIAPGKEPFPERGKHGSFINRFDGLHRLLGGDVGIDLSCITFSLPS